LCDFVAMAGTFAMAAIRYSGPLPHRGIFHVFLQSINFFI